MIALAPQIGEFAVRRAMNRVRDAKAPLLIAGD